LLPEVLYELERPFEEYDLVPADKDCYFIVFLDNCKAQKVNSSNLWACLDKSNIPVNDIDKYELSHLHMISERHKTIYKQDTWLDAANSPPSFYLCSLPNTLTTVNEKLQTY
jgi:hypothetical protein